MEDPFLPRRYACAGPSCTTVGNHTCQRCLLVKYCGRDCQKAHWPKHKEDCNHPMMKTHWRPRWELRNEIPSLGIYGWPVRSSETGKFLWGNIPAYDLLQLDGNEGSGLGQDLSLLLAASGDLRNVIKTIDSMPEGYNGKLSIVLNDRDPLIVARNFAMLWLLLEDDNAQQAATDIVHLWYSAFIPPSLLARLRGGICSSVSTFCNQIQSEPVDSVQTKTFKFGRCLLRMALKQTMWLSLRAHLQGSAQSLTEAKNNRLAATMAPERLDDRDNEFFHQTPSRRLCELRFRENGVLLPFAASPDAFNVPNPTLFDESGLWWLPDISADPLFGWNQTEVKTARGAPAHDAYGKLYFYVVDLLSSVHGKVQGLSVEFQLYGDNAENLPQRLGYAKFDRIETSNLADFKFLGLFPTVSHLQSLLKPPEMNPHATLITLCMNAVAQEVMTEPDAKDEEKALKLAEHCLPLTGQNPMQNRTDRLRQQSFKQVLLDFDLYFNRHVLYCSMTEHICQEMQVQWKDNHTIIERWPLRITGRGGQEGLVKEFLEMRSTGWERYVEWHYKQ